MRIARKLILLISLAVAATTSAASLASAQSEPLIHHAFPDLAVSTEPAGTPCPAVVRNGATNVVTGGCVVHGRGPDIVLTGHLFGIESVQSTCNVEFDLRTDVDAEGYLVHQELTQGAQGTCTREPCGSGSASAPEGRPWEVSGREKSTAPTEILTMLLCIQNLDGSSPTHCEVDVQLVETNFHRYSFAAPGFGVRGHGASQPFCEIAGTFATEILQSGSAEGQNRSHIEVNHL